MLMGLLCLKRLRGEGPWGGGSFTRDPGRYVQVVSGYGHLSLHRGPYSTEGNLVSVGEARIPGTLKDG